MSGRDRRLHRRVSRSEGTPRDVESTQQKAIGRHDSDFGVERRALPSEGLKNAHLWCFQPTLAELFGWRRGGPMEETC